MAAKRFTRRPDHKRKDRPMEFRPFIAGPTQHGQESLLERPPDPTEPSHDDKFLQKLSDKGQLQNMYGPGYKLLKKAGWSGGSLGHINNVDAIATPLITISKNDRKGITSVSERIEKNRTSSGLSKKKASEKRRLARRKEEKMQGMTKGSLTPVEIGRNGHVRTESKPGHGTLKTRAKKKAKWRKKLEHRLNLKPGSLSQGNILEASRSVIASLERNYGLKRGELQSEVDAYKGHIHALRSSASADSFGRNRFRGRGLQRGFKRSRPSYSPRSGIKRQKATIPPAHIPTARREWNPPPPRDIYGNQNLPVNQNFSVEPNTWPNNGYHHQKRPSVPLGQVERVNYFYPLQPVTSQRSLQPVPSRGWTQGFVVQQTPIQLAQPPPPSNPPPWQNPHYPMR